MSKTRRTDWPAAEVEKVRRALSAAAGADEDLGADALVAVIAVPFGDVRSKGGPVAYARGVLRHKRADRVRSQRRERELKDASKAVERTRTELMRSASLKRSADHRVEKKRFLQVPPEASKVDDAINKSTLPWGYLLDAEKSSRRAM